MRYPAIILILCAALWSGCEAGSGDGVKMGTSKETARSFFAAAQAGDMAAIEQLCNEDVLSAAQSVAAAIQAADLPRPSWRGMQVDAPLEGWQAAWSAKVLALELENVDGEWKIAAIAFSGM